MKKLHNERFKKWKHVVSLLLTMSFLFMSKVAVLAETKEDKGSAGNAIETSSFGKGLKDLLSDASAFLLVLSPIVGALFGIYFFLRKNGADEQDQKKWNTRLIITGVCVVGAVLVSGTLTVITGYFK